MGRCYKGTKQNTKISVAYPYLSKYVSNELNFIFDQRVEHILVLQECTVYYLDYIFEFSVFCVMWGFFILENKKVSAWVCLSENIRCLNSV